MCAAPLAPLIRTLPAGIDSLALPTPFPVGPVNLDAPGQSARWGGPDGGGACRLDWSAHLRWTVKLYQSVS